MHPKYHISRAEKRQEDMTWPMRNSIIHFFYGMPAKYRHYNSALKCARRTSIDLFKHIYRDAWVGTKSKVWCICRGMLHSDFHIDSRFQKEKQSCLRWTVCLIQVRKKRVSLNLTAPFIDVKALVSSILINQSVLSTTYSIINNFR